MSEFGFQYSSNSSPSTPTYYVKYYVGKNLAFGNYNFNTIQDAIDQALIDGVSYSTPCLILIYPDDYIENVITYNGISLVSLGGTVNLKGTLTVLSDSTQELDVHYEKVNIFGDIVVDGDASSPLSSVKFSFCRIEGSIIAVNYQKNITFYYEGVSQLSNVDQSIIESSIAETGLIANNSQLTRTPFVSQDILILNGATKITNCNIVGGKVTHTGSTQFRTYSTTYVTFNQECLKIDNTNNSNELFYCVLERRGTIGHSIMKTNTGNLEISGTTYRGTVVNVPLIIAGGTVNGGQALVPVYAVTTNNNAVTPIISLPIPNNVEREISFVIKGRNATTGAIMISKGWFAANNISGVASIVSAPTTDRKSNFPATVQTSVTVSTSNVIINITGPNAQTINWKLYITEII